MFRTPTGLSLWLADWHTMGQPAKGVSGSVERATFCDEPSEVKKDFANSFTQSSEHFFSRISTARSSMRCLITHAQILCRR